MFASRFFPARMFASRFFPHVGAAEAPATEYAILVTKAGLFGVLKKI